MEETKMQEEQTTPQMPQEGSEPTPGTPPTPPAGTPVPPEGEDENPNRGM